MNYHLLKADGAVQLHRSYASDEQSDSSSGLNKRTWGIIGAVTATAVTLASLAYVFRGAIPIDRIKKL